MKQIVLPILIVFFISSCKKDKGNDKPTPTVYAFAGLIGMNDNSTLVTSDNNLLICTDFTGGGGLYKVSKAGNLIWNYNYFPFSNGTCSGIAESSTHDYFVCGSTFESSTQNNFTLLKVNPNGNLIWSKIYERPTDNYAKEIICTTDSNLLISGTTYNPTTFSTDILVIKVNTNGDTIWTKTYPAPINYSITPLHLIQTRNGEYLITGSSTSNSGCPYLLKIDTNGTKLWYNLITTSANKHSATSALELSNGDILFCGKSDYSLLLTRIDHLGNIIWEKDLWPGVLQSEGNSIKQNADGTFTILANAASSDSQSTFNTLNLMKVDGNGNLIWTKAVKLIFNIEKGPVNLFKDYNDDNIITGDETGYGPIFMTKTDSNGNFK